MYGKLNALLRSRLAVWGVATIAIIIFCVTATLAFGMRDNKKPAGESPVGKIPSIQSSVSGLQVQSAPAASSGSAAQLQGQEGNGMASQPAAPAASSSLPELNSGVAASQMQAGAAATVGPASTSLSASLQPSADMNANGANVQGSLNALSAGLNLNARLP